MWVCVHVCVSVCVGGMAGRGWVWVSMGVSETWSNFLCKYLTARLAWPTGIAQLPTHMNESWTIYEQVISHMKASCHTHDQPHPQESPNCAHLRTNQLTQLTSIRWMEKSWGGQA